MTRPTHKELSNKLKQAWNFVQNAQVFIINQAALAADALELDYSIKFELLEVLNELLERQPRQTILEADPQKDRMKMKSQAWICLRL